MHKKLNIRTSSGLSINLLDPSPTEINVVDIAKGLSFKSCMNGQIPKYYSLAEHSLVIEYLVSQKNPDDIKLRLAALLNNASEAYLGTIPDSFKAIFPEFCILEKKLRHAILLKFGLEDLVSFDVKSFEKKANTLELATFFNNYKAANVIYFMPPEVAYTFYYERFNSLLDKIYTA